MTQQPHRIKDDYLRDLGLVLIGYALSKSDRQRILDSVPPGLLIKEMDDLLRSIRSNKPTVLSDWCETRGAILEKGKDCIQAIIDALQGEQRRQRVKSVLQRLGTDAKLLDPVSLAAKLRECAEELDGLTNMGIEE